MPALTQTVVATTTHQVKIEPKLKRRLLVELRTYAELKSQQAALKKAMDKKRANIEDVLGDIGESSLSVEGFKTTLVAPVRTVLDEKKLIANGVTMDQIEASKTQKATKPYVKVTCPGDRDDSE